MANINPYEPMAKARVATAMSASLSFCAERKYLQDIDSENSRFKICPLANSAQLDAKWISWPSSRERTRKLFCGHSENTIFLFHAQKSAIAFLDCRQWRGMQYVLGIKRK